MAKPGILARKARTTCYGSRMQYPSRRLLLLAAMLVTGCVETEPVDPEPRDECANRADPKVLDIELSGLDDTRSYQFVIEAEGGLITLIRTPEQRNTFGEALLPDGGVLVASLGADTLRVFVDDAEREHGPQSVHVTAWSRNGLIAESTFMPAYERAVPVEGDCFSTITEHLALPPHQ